MNADGLKEDKIMTKSVALKKKMDQKIKELRQKGFKGDIKEA